MLDSVPDIDLLEHLPKFIDGLFKILSDPNSVSCLVGDSVMH